MYNCVTSQDLIQNRALDCLVAMDSHQVRPDFKSRDTESLGENFSQITRSIDTENCLWPVFQVFFLTKKYGLCYFISPNTSWEILNGTKLVDIIMFLKYSTVHMVTFYNKEILSHKHQ